MVNPYWPRQEIFCKRVKAFAVKNGLITCRGAINLALMAPILGIGEYTLKQFLQYKSRRRPHLDTLTHVASVLGCSVADFLDDAGDPPPIMSIDNWRELSEQERTYAAALLADITTQELTLSEKELLFGVFQDLKARILKMRE